MLKLKNVRSLAVLLIPGAIVGAGFLRIGAVALVAGALVTFPWRAMRRS